MNNTDKLEVAFLIAWVVWWLWAVNWHRAWPILSIGGWAPLVLLTLTAALAWSQLNPSELYLFGFLHVPNFWWQLVVTGLYVALALFCGWLQGYFGWTPAEVAVEPPAHEPGHDHEVVHQSDHHH